MKNSILVILAALFSLQIHAQDPDLFEHTWYLQEVIIDNTSTNHPMPQYEIMLYFDENNDSEFIYSLIIDIPICNSGPVGYISNFDSDDLFEMDSFAWTLLDECPMELEDFMDFVNEHHFIFSPTKGAPPKNPFTYTLETENDTQFLTIENTDGDYAVYSNQELSISSFEATTFSAYPNPTNEVLHITNSGQAQKASIYSITGQKVTEHTDSFNEINVRHLQNGVYFLVLESPEGEKQTHRFVKE